VGLAKREMEAGKVEPTNRLLSGSPIRSAMWSKISRLKRGGVAEPDEVSTVSLGKGETLFAS